MEELEVTWKRTLQIWWAWTWRSVLFAFLGSFIIGFILGLSAAMIFGPEIAETVTFISSIVGGIFGLLVGLFMMKLVLNKKFNSFRIALIKE